MHGFTGRNRGLQLAGETDVATVYGDGDTVLQSSVLIYEVTADIVVLFDQLIQDLCNRTWPEIYLRTTSRVSAQRLGYHHCDLCAWLQVSHISVIFWYLYDSATVFT